MTRSYPPVVLLASLVAGIALEYLVVIPLSVLVFLTVAPAIVGIIWGVRDQKSISSIFLLSAFFFFGALSYNIRYQQESATHLASIAESRRLYTIHGSVDDWPQLKRYYTEITIRVDSLVASESQIVRSGKLLLRITDTTTALQRGDRVLFQGRIQPPYRRGSFDYPAYLRHREIVGIVYLPTTLNIRVERRHPLGIMAAVDDFRDNLVGAIQTILPPEPAALASGFLIGQTRDIPSHVYESFLDTGTLHLLAVSGSNVSLILLFVAFLFRPLGIWAVTRRILLIAATILFSLLAYGEPSVIRASLMAILFLLSELMGRKVNLNNIVALSALLILLYDPAQLFDAGFQLSYAVAWGLLTTTPPVAEIIRARVKQKWLQWVLLLTAGSAIAQLFSMPLLAFYFDRVQPISFIANIVIIPLASVALIAVLIALLLYLIVPIVGLFAGSLIAPVYQLLLSALEWFGKYSAPSLIPFSDYSNTLKLILLVCIYATLVLGALSLVNRMPRKAFLVMLLVACSIPIGVAAKDYVQGRQTVLHVARLSGGLLSVLDDQERQSTTMIVDGFFRMNRATTESVILPTLRGWGIEKIDRIIVQEIDMSAIGTIRSVAEKTNCTVIFLPKTIQSMWEQSSSSYGPSRVSFAVEYYQLLAVDSLADSSGWKISTDRIVCTLPQTQIRWQEQVVPDSTNTSDAMRRGSNMIIARECFDVHAVLDSTSQHVFLCSKVAQEGAGESSSDPSQATSLSVNYQFINLSELGTISYRIDRNGTLIRR